jgi:RAD51-like protein 2
MSSRRSLLSLGLPRDVLAALTRLGYETLQDLGSITAEELSEGEYQSLMVNFLWE